MIRHGAFNIVLAALISGVLNGGSVASAGDEALAVPDDTTVNVPLSVTPDEESSEEEYTAVELPLAEIKVETHRLLLASGGYRFFSTDRYGLRAARFEDLRSGPVLGFTNSILGKDHKFALDGSYLTDDDYHGDLTYDYMGAYKVHFRTESFLHNLDNLPSAVPVPLSLGSTYQKGIVDDVSSYGIRTEQDLAAIRARVSTYPIHLNLNYWRMIKEGSRQLRFADHAFYPHDPNDPDRYANRFNATSRGLNRETHEGIIGFDASLGLIDIIYDFTLRQFNDHAAIPTYQYQSDRTPVTPHTINNELSFGRGVGLYEHDETPDSRYYSHTVKLHTEQTGGLVSAASYTFSQRKNNSSLAQVKGVNGLSETQQSVAGDVVYIPCKEFSLAVRFRHQEIDRDTAVLQLQNFFPATIVANQGLDTRKNVISTILSIKPVNAITIKGEYRGAFIHRDNADSWNPDAIKISGISLPTDSERHRGTLTLLARPYNGVRVKAKYSFNASNRPEYGNSYDKLHEGQLLASYSLKDRLGILFNYMISQANNDSGKISTLNAAVDPMQLARERRQINATASVWGNLLDGRLSLTATTGLLRSTADQQTLFSAVSATDSSTATNYTSQAFLYGVTAALRPIEKLTTSLTFQQIRSVAEFDPVYKSYGFDDTVGVKELSWLKTVENSVSFIGNYQFHKNFSSGVTYNFREYTDERNSLYNGSVHSVIANLTAKW